MATLRDYSQGDFQKLNLNELESLCRERRNNKVRASISQNVKNAIETVQGWFAHQQSSEPIVLVFSDAGKH